MKISFLMPAYNEAKMLPKTLTELCQEMKALRSSGIESELIVCDNNSSDETASIASRFGAIIVSEPINQISRARNRAASVASGDWLIFLDADTWPSRELLSKAVHHIQSGRCLGGGSTIRFDDPALEGRILVSLWNLISRLGRLAAGSFIFVERASFVDLSGFNENIYAGEEIDFSIRAKKLARIKSQNWVILNSHPVLTSARKLRLYSFAERLKQIWNILRSHGTPMQKDTCDLWYDGRR